MKLDEIILKHWGLNVDLTALRNDLEKWGKEIYQDGWTQGQLNPDKLKSNWEKCKELFLGKLKP